MNSLRICMTDCLSTVLPKFWASPFPLLIMAFYSDLKTSFVSQPIFLNRCWTHKELIRKAFRKLKFLSWFILEYHHQIFTIHFDHSARFRVSFGQKTTNVSDLDSAIKFIIYQIRMIEATCIFCRFFGFVLLNFGANKVFGFFEICESPFGRLLFELI